MYNRGMKEKQPEQKIQIRFPVDMWESLKELAQEDHRSLNGEVIWILQDYIKRRKDTSQQS